MSDLISRVELFNKIAPLWTVDEIYGAINSLQAVTLPIVYCKDCRYKKRKGVDYYCDHITGEEIMVSPNDYCSWGERDKT